MQSSTAGHEADRGAMAAGLTCYLIWGGFPLFWPLLKPAGSLEILANRVVWSLVLVALALVLLRRGWGWIRSQALPHWQALLAASVLIALNWLTYIWAVNSSHVVEASLGYFINPLVSIGLGMLLFGERPGRPGVVGIVLATIGVVVIGSGAWRTLWISLVLAFSFGFYGVVKKRAHLGALEGLFVESLVLAPLSLAWMGWLASKGELVFGSSLRASLLLVAAGLLTAVPLWLFATAAPRIPLGTLGLFQYIAPTMQLLLGLFVFHQHVSGSYWAGMVLVWIGCAFYLTGVLVRTRQRTA